MSEKEIDRCLRTKAYSVASDLVLEQSSEYIDLSQSSRKSNTTILPLSLENNSTRAGTGTLLDQFASERSLPQDPRQLDTLPFMKIPRHSA